MIRVIKWVNLKAEGEPEKSTLSWTHIPAIRFHHIFPLLKREKEGVYYML